MKKLQLTFGHDHTFLAKCYISIIIIVTLEHLVGPYYVLTVVVLLLV